MQGRSSIPVLVAVLASVLAAAGCGTVGTQSPEENGVTSRSIEINGGVVETNDMATGQKVQVRGTPIAAMSALAAIYNDLKIPIGTMVPSAGEIGNANLRVPSHRVNGRALSDYLNCGTEQAGVSRADMADVSISIMSKAIAVGDSASDVTTALTGRANSVGSSTNQVPCQSTGDLEHLINVRLAAAMGKSA